ncbi:MAG: YraN family protein [Phycisphaeraceae bacterium]
MRWRDCGTIRSYMNVLRRILSHWFGPVNYARRGEKLAAKFLKKKGYRILARNLRLKHGEIDLLAEAPDGRTIVVVEVKSSTPDAKAGNPRPETHVNAAKERQLAMLAMQVVKLHRLQDRPVRFDVIGVDMRSDGSVEIRHHESAFESKW